jgi:hypothetical protein
MLSNNLKRIRFFVMAGHSRPKDGVASARLRPGHPRLSRCWPVKTWMPGTSPGMTSFAKGADFYWPHFESDSEEHREAMRLEPRGHGIRRHSHLQALGHARHTNKKPGARPGFGLKR